MTQTIKSSSKYFWFE